MAKTYIVSRHVDASPERVFDAATNLREAAQNVRGIKSLDVLTDGPIGVGTRFRETRVVFGKEATEEMEITAFDRPRLYRVEADSCGCHYVTDIHVEPKDGGTELRFEFTPEPQSFFAKALSFAMRPMMKACLKAIEGDMDDVKAVAEGRTPEGSAAAPQSV